MNTEKLSISIPRSLALFLSEYQLSHEYKSKSEVIKDALKLLQQKTLEAAYLQANSEIDPDFDVTAADGIEDETW